MRCFAVLSLTTALVMAATTAPSRALDQIAVTEPNHVVGYLPLYVTQRRGFFAEEGIEVKWTTIENGSGPSSARAANWSSSS